MRVSFGERDVQSLSFVATQASVAVRNAQLVQRLNQLAGELEQRVTLTHRRIGPNAERLNRRT